MHRRKRPASRAVTHITLSGAIAALAYVVAGVFPASATADENVLGTNLSWNELTYCVSHPVDCANARDAQQWAQSVAASRYSGESLHNGEGDAYRHCLWSGAMAQRMGSAGALAIADNHEVKGAQPASEASMDSYNNHIGATIGDQSNTVGTSDTWGWIMNQCYQRAQEGALYGQGGRIAGDTVA